MKLYATYNAFPCDEKGVKRKVHGRIEVDSTKIMTRDEVLEAARAKVYASVPSLRGAPIFFIECGLIEEAA